MVSDVKIRLEKDEWYYLLEKWPHVAFNTISFRGSFPNNRSHGKKHLVVCEPYIGMPANWDINRIKRYDTYITYNEKFYNKYKNELKHLKTYIVKGCLGCNAYWHLDSFTPYDEKIKGVCFLNKLYNTHREGDIAHIRERVVLELKKYSDLTVHVWSRKPWGNTCYQGHLPYYHSHIKNLKKISEYLFCACFESTYHKLWSWGFITERLFNCFKSKTVPIYFGCYNIEDYVPKDLFIDYRDFGMNNKALAEYLTNFPKDKYDEMIEKAFEWQESNRIGNIEDLETILGTLER